MLPQRFVREPNRQDFTRNISEYARTRLKADIVAFLNNPTLQKVVFPESLSKNERAFLHLIARTNGLESFSVGKDSKRRITVFKSTVKTVNTENTALLTVSLRTIKDLLEQFPLTDYDENTIISQLPQDPAPLKGSFYKNRPRVPDLHQNRYYVNSRSSLPIYKNRDEILSAIESNAVVIISGETGCGKTTQVPQYILEDAQANNRPVRIMCSMPRRVATVAVSERVALECGENVGNHIGYQIKLENRFSRHTVLIYCTNGVLLRHLLSTGSDLSNITHIIIDEIHERDRLSDFSLIALRQILSKNTQLRLILMSATLNTDLFDNYFKNYLPYGKACPVITIPGKVHPVDELFLEDIIPRLQYCTKEMAAIGKSEHLATVIRKSKHLATATGSDQEEDDVDENTKRKINNLLKHGALTGQQDMFDELVEMIIEHKSLINFKEYSYGMTGLMVAIAHRNCDIVEKLLEFLPSLDIHDHIGWTILDWANRCEDENIIGIVNSYAQRAKVRTNKSIDTNSQNAQTELYLKCDGKNDYDPQLIVAIVKHIHSGKKQGAILIFLAGYEQILAVKDTIYLEKEQLERNGKILIYVLHSKVQVTQQMSVFRKAPTGSRKIILATNIAETGITINDVVFVIDSGKVKQQNYNSASGVYSLESEWVSQACAKQRMGRAGRTCSGVCFHLFTREQHSQMEPYHVPELLREPLEELCLQAKRLIPPQSPIADFLSQAIEPPSTTAINNAIQSLKTMEALDANENLTYLGCQIIGLTIEPQLAKIVIYGVILKCLDPVLTIVCCLSEGDPFKFPTDPELKRAVTQSKVKLALSSVSDHMVLLHAFEKYQLAKRERNESKFCDSFFVNGAILDAVVGMRNQLLKQLKVSDPKEVNKYSDQWAVVKAAITAGLYPNLAKSDKRQKNICTKKEGRVIIQPSSVVRENKAGENKKVLPSEWIVFQELHSVGTLSNIRTCTAVSPVTVCLFAGPSQPQPFAAQDETPSETPVSDDTVDQAIGGDDKKIAEENGDEILGSATFFKVDEWIDIPMDLMSTQMLCLLGLKWRALIDRRLCDLHATWSREDIAILDTMVKVLTAEDRALGFTEPLRLMIPNATRGTDYTTSPWF